MAKKEKKFVIEPLEDRVLIRRLDVEDTTPGGIVLPDTAKEKPQRGEVVSVGPGKLLDSGERAPLSVKKGDEVLFGKYSGSDVKIADEEFLIMRESDILARVEN
ncbi:MAG: co-chaperone GroES [Planctomycetes bacterium]|nr:co-chaperone GroES [Planctomycetota bacterium]